MKILSIETSCDETAVSLVEFHTENNLTLANVLGNKLYSQVKLHAEFGGVYPNLAKREHTKNLGPLILETLREADHYKELMQPLPPTQIIELEKILKREPELFTDLVKLLTAIEKPEIDAIAVTEGPGLEPALWVGINGARALAHAWNIPLIPVNHMEGHLFSSVLTATEKSAYAIPPVTFPALALLISGGHTELVKINAWGSYTVLGETRDDAVGEAFDKVARMLGLSYPGGPEVSKYADRARAKNIPATPALPRPMLKSGDFDFSFSGLKTAVRYHIDTLREVTEKNREEISRAFEESVTDVFLEKSKKALKEHGMKTFIMGGGVSANKNLRETFKNELPRSFPEISLYLPEISLTTDNAVMIAIAGYFKHLRREKDPSNLVARGTLPLSA